MQYSKCECPKASRTMQHTILFSTPWWRITLVAFLAAAANRKNLRISTNQQLSEIIVSRLQLPALEFSFMQSQCDYSQTPRHITIHTAIREVHKKSFWKSSAPVSLLEAAQYHSNLEITVCISYTTTAIEVLNKTDHSTEFFRGRGERGGRDVTSRIPVHPEQGPLSPALSSYPLISFQVLNLNWS